MRKLPKIQSGLGVVGTWISPENKLGGSLPIFLEETEKQALNAAVDNERLMSFLGETKQYLCKITIEPIAEVESKEKIIFELK